MVSGGRGDYFFGEEELKCHRMWMKVTTFSTELMLNSVIYRLKLFILHEKTYTRNKKKFNNASVVSKELHMKKKIRIPKIAHILYNYIETHSVACCLFCVTPNRKLILHLNYIYIYLHHSLGSPKTFRVALCYVMCIPFTSEQQQKKILNTDSIE